MAASDEIGGILGIAPELLQKLDAVMVKKTGRRGVLDRIAEESNGLLFLAMKALGMEQKGHSIREVLRNTIERHERQLLQYLDKISGKTEFDKAALLARRIARVGKGFFLKHEYAKEILRKRPPRHLLEYLALKNIEELFLRFDITEAFSALRFMESDQWMHETFEAAYSRFGPDDFEERDIEIKVLGPEWKEVAAKFVAKKHHNVSHLKEFGVIFLNPIREDLPGKFLRDFALLLHYFHEVEFYSKLFRRYASGRGFAERLKALLRGDVLEVQGVKAGEWLIVQRYLFKENPKDPRLFLPRVNPEAMHWARGERDLAVLGEHETSLDLELWRNLDWIGCRCLVNSDDIVSFDLEDNAMSLVSAKEGKPQFFTYHQREAMWTKIFSEYAGGESAMENLLIKNFDRGIIRF